MTLTISILHELLISLSFKFSLLVSSLLFPIPTILILHSRITRESDNVTNKSNAWMQAKSEEVKLLQEKMKEANRIASSLRSEKKNLVEATDLLQTTNNQLKANIGAFYFLLSFSLVCYWVNRKCSGEYDALWNIDR